MLVTADQELSPQSPSADSLALGSVVLRSMVTLLSVRLQVSKLEDSKLIIDFDPIDEYTFHNAVWKVPNWKVSHVRVEGGR